jgi:hypothetical protein
MPDPTGRVLWEVEHTHPSYGYESASLVVNLADELLIVVAECEEAASTLTRDDARGLRDALTAYLDEGVELS